MAGDSLNPLPLQTIYCRRCGRLMIRVDVESMESTKPRIRWECSHCDYWEPIGYDPHEEV